MPAVGAIDLSSLTSCPIGVAGCDDSRSESANPVGFRIISVEQEQAAFFDIPDLWIYVGGEAVADGCPTEPTIGGRIAIGIRLEC